MTPSQGIEAGPHCWEASALSPLRQPCIPLIYAPSIIVLFGQVVTDNTHDPGYCTVYCLLYL